MHMLMLLFFRSFSFVFLLKNMHYASGNSQMARGWPPIKICRMNSLAIHSKDCTSEAETSVQKKIDKIVVKEDTDSNNQEKYIRCTVSTHFVKVNMDGDPIGRKVDLNAHNSYETLALALEDMFCKSNNDHDTFTCEFTFVFSP